MKRVFGLAGLLTVRAMLFPAFDFLIALSFGYEGALRSLRAPARRFGSIKLHHYACVNAGDQVQLPVSAVNRYDAPSVFLRDLFWQSDRAA